MTAVTNIPFCPMMRGGLGVCFALTAMAACAGAFVVPPAAVSGSSLALRVRRGGGARLSRGVGAVGRGLTVRCQELGTRAAEGVEEVPEAVTQPMRLSAALERARQEGWTEQLVREGLDAAKEGGEAVLWRHTKPNFRRSTLGEVRMLTRGVIKPDAIDISGEDDMEVLNISFFTSLFASMFLSTVAGVMVPDLDMPFFQGGFFRYCLTFAIGSLPFAFLGLGLSLPGLLQAALIQVRRLLSDEFRDRLAVHEAGHFLVGHCLGLPVADYKADDAILNAVQFFDVEQGGLMGFARRLTHEQVDVMCAISMAGVVAESIKYGNGVGGFADLSQLQGYLSRATPILDDKEQMERVRWGTVSAYTILKNNDAAFQALVACMRDGRSVEQCIEVIEEVGREEAKKEDPLWK